MYSSGSENVSPWPVSVKYGTIISLILIVLSLGLYVSGLNDPVKPSAANQVAGCLNYVIMIVGVVMAIKFHRDKELGGYLAMGRGISVGALTGLVMGLISAVWMLIYMKFIVGDMSEIMMEAAMENAQPGSEEMVEKMIGIFSNPFILAGFSLLASVILGFLTGLVAGAIMKRESPMSV